FFRAMQLFDLVSVYGAVPVVNKVLMAADRQGAKDYNRESVETCVIQILSDLKEAANLLPTSIEWGSEQNGR
ncbi:RagB/SusD family nutrient uptake outer membrane protein, partial [Phocaeicola vulgatus]|uniref:RagB/SusD family nutrient uptake outer membrane protein n=1 Tax=Phocaeicola vulgatus TaxID=821 RepID=UPI00210EAFF4